MKIKIISTILALFLVPLFASAQGVQGNVVRNGNHVSLVAPDATPSSLNLVAPNAASSVNILTGGTNRLSVSGAGVISVPAATDVLNVPYVPTMVATPVATVNAFVGRVNVVPTAAANTAALLPTGPTAGTIREIVNSGPNTIRIKPGGTNTINGGTAGAYTVALTKETVRCIADASTTNWICNTVAVAPTPAGP